MRTATPRLLAALLLILTGTLAAAQSTTGTIQGSVKDNQDAIVRAATVTVRNTETGATRSLVTDDNGAYRFLNMPVGTYELTVEQPGFSKYVRSGITLSLNQDAVINVQIQPAGVSESIQVTADSPLLNTTTPEVGVRFDAMRVSELPVANSRDVFSVALSAPGVSQLGSGQAVFASGTNFSANGMRVRSNNFMIDGQDSNDPSVTGRQQPLNNTDIIQELRLITNQFAAEYGRAAGSIVNAVTKNGTNQFRGSGFIFANRDEWNARNNLDSRIREDAPPREETQWGGTLGGPVLRNKTFFFGSYQRWTDRQLGAGVTLNGAPTAAGRAVLEGLAAGRPHVAALLDHIPVAQSSTGQTVPVTVAGVTQNVEIGALTGSSEIKFDNNQAIARVDHQFSPNHTLTSRYLLGHTPENSGTGQVTPTGLTTFIDSNQHSLNTWLNSVLGQNMSNEFRAAWSHLGTNTLALNTKAEEIPSIEINDLGMTGFNAGATRTAFGLAVNLPQYRFNDTYQFQNNFTFLRGNHAFKAGADVRRQYVKSFFLPTTRGRLVYTTLNNFVNDIAQTATINKPLPGGAEIAYYRWWDQYYFLQDEWRALSNLTLSLGVRYEIPGNNIQSLIDLNDQILQANQNNQAFRFQPTPKTDYNNFQPRLGFNWQPRSEGGVLGMLTGGDKLVVRGGYARTHDYAFLNLALNIFSSFPFVAAINLPAGTSGAFAALQNIPPGVPAGVDPNQLVRTVVAEDFRAPVADQFSLEFQRQLTTNVVARIGYVGTFGDDLFQTLDGNPTIPNSTTVREDPSRGVIRLRANAAQSWYHSLQTGLEKRFSGGLGAGVHYTWSRYLDTASDTFNPSSAEVAVAQDSRNIKADKAVSSYDRPHRLTGNFVWELPWWRDQQGFLGKILGGWQLASFFTAQSGAPFTVLNGTDPTGALFGIDGLVGNAIRPNLNTDLNLSKMTIEEILAAGGASLFSRLCNNATGLVLSCTERLGNVGRNTLRADGIGNVDFSITKNTRFLNGHNLQFRIELFNATNTRNFGIPPGAVNSTNFLNQWGTDGGNRRIWLVARYTY